MKLALLILVTIAPKQSFAFAPVKSIGCFASKNPYQRIPIASNTNSPLYIADKSGMTKYTNLKMASNDEGPGLITQVGILLIMALFAVTSLLPLLDGGGRDLSIADSVVTQQDIPGKLQNFESKGDRLSRATIQEKISGIPVFFLTDSSGNMETNIYVSYSDAKAAADGGSGFKVKATSLDQVMYPLILKRGRMRMAPPPSEVEKAEIELSASAESGSAGKTYKLIPSKASIDQAKEFNLDLAENDIPLFVADRLAFAGPKGPQLPLFTDKSDCMLSYQRLRGSKSTLPEQPIIRTATLLNELNSMEKGTRPGVSQLAFYATANDVEKASELLQ